MTRPLPPHLRAALGKGHAKSDVWRLVTQFETLGHPVRVIRYQLGDMMADDFFAKTEIYRSKEKTDEAGTLAGTHQIPGKTSR